MNPWNAKVGEQEIPIKEHTIKKGRTQGATFFGPDFETLTFEQAENAWGREKIWNDIIVPELRRFSNVISKEAKEDAKDDEQMFIERFNQMLTDFSARGLTIKALKERVRELTEELSGVKPKITNGLPDLQDKETLRFFSIAGKLQKAQQALDEKKSKDEEEPAEESTAPAVAA